MARECLDGFLGRLCFVSMKKKERKKKPSRISWNKHTSKLLVLSPVLRYNILLCGAASFPGEGPGIRAGLMDSPHLLWRGETLAVHLRLPGSRGLFGFIAMMPRRETQWGALTHTHTHKQRRGLSCSTTKVSTVGCNCRWLCVGLCDVWFPWTLLDCDKWKNAIQNLIFTSFPKKWRTLLDLIKPYTTYSHAAYLSWSAGEQKVGVWPPSWPGHKRPWRSGCP